MPRVAKFEDGGNAGQIKRFCFLITIKYQYASSGGNVDKESFSDKAPYARAYIVFGPFFYDALRLCVWRLRELLGWRKVRRSAAPDNSNNGT